MTPADHGALHELWDGFLDLVLGAACVGCGRPGRPLCSPCRDVLPREAAACPPSPRPGRSSGPPAPVVAAGPYDGVVRAMVIAHKERRILSLGPPLGELLAGAVRLATRQAGLADDAALLLVPVPSRPAAVRQRGHDATAEVTRAAARALRREGGSVRVARLLRVRRRLADQAGLGVRERATNLDGALAVRAVVQRRHAAGPAVHVVVCDDVVTTGASLREAQRALGATGVRVLAAATVAATPRRSARAPGGRGGAGPETPS